MWVRGEPIIEAGEVVRIVGFARDVTDRRRRERQLTVMDTLLRHNLRNDMSIVIGNAELIVTEGDESSAERAEVVRKQGQALIESAEKQREIIELLTSRPIPRSQNLTETVEDAIGVVRQRHPGLSVDVNLPDGIAVDALDELRLAIAELIENAVEYDPDDAPRASVSAVVDGGAVEIVIEDECPPIPEVEHRVLTGDWAMDDVYHTSGLGLWLVYWIVDLSDGDVTFAQPKSGGNTVRLRLPRADGATGG